MNKIPNENWQSYMLRELSKEAETIWIPGWLATAVKTVGQLFGCLFVLTFFCYIPALAWEIACALVDALH